MMVWLRRSVHPSWLVAVLALGVVIGVVWMSSVAVRSPLLTTTIMLVLVAFWRPRNWKLALVLVAGLLIGSWRGGSELVERAAYQSLYSESVTLTGVVKEDVDIGSQGQPVLRLDDITVADSNLPGVVWVSLEAGSAESDTIRRSDQLTVEGRLSEGFGSFPASIYRAKVLDLARPTPGDIALRLRDWFASHVRQVIPEPAASLGVGYLVGQRRALPPELDESLRIAGLTHVVVASGYNLTILVRLSRRLFVRVSKFIATAAAGGMVVTFIAVTGMSPSMSRAGLVAGLSLLAWYYGRRLHPLVLLPLAAAVTLLINPGYGWNDLGWQLSFASFAGVLIVAPLVQGYFFGADRPGVIRQILGETTAAQVVTLPIIALAFGVVSNVALIANLLVLPLVPLAMLLTFVAGLASWLAPFMADWLAQPATWLLTYMTEAAQWVAGLSWAEAELEPSIWAVAGFYALLAAACFYMHRQTGLVLRDHNLVE